jgi:hypothetical protein
MSGTPIFEQLCRDFVDAGKTRPADVGQPPIASHPSTIPAHSISSAGRSRGYERGGHLSPAPGEWVRPGE